MDGARETSLTFSIGMGNSGNYNADAIIEGLRIDRFVWYDGTYGTDIGVGDLINLVYNAGSGADPALHDAPSGCLLDLSQL